MPPPNGFILRVEGALSSFGFLAAAWHALTGSARRPRHALLKDIMRQPGALITGTPRKLLHYADARKAIDAEVMVIYRANKMPLLLRGQIRLENIFDIGNDFTHDDMMHLRRGQAIIGCWH